MQANDGETIEVSYVGYATQNAKGEHHVAHDHRYGRRQEVTERGGGDGFGY